MAPAVAVTAADRFRSARAFWGSIHSASARLAASDSRGIAISYADQTEQRCHHEPAERHHAGVHVAVRAMISGRIRLPSIWLTISTNSALVGDWASPARIGESR